MFEVHHITVNVLPFLRARGSQRGAVMARVCKALSYISGRESSSADAEWLQKYLGLFKDLKGCKTGIMM